MVIAREKEQINKNLSWSDVAIQHDDEQSFGWNRTPAFMPSQKIHLNLLGIFRVGAKRELHITNSKQKGKIKRDYLKEN